MPCGTKTLKPYQGLKRNTEFGIACVHPWHKNPKTLSGIETLRRYDDWAFDFISEAQKP